tara:strand:+ start:432 stop:815 length:384 start_codon:yes stop_codon:yes gene_type:complete
MKTLLATTALIGAFATSASAIDWSWENEITAEYAVDAEKTSMVYEPEMTIGLATDWELDIGTKIHIYDSTAKDNFMLFDTLEEGSRPNLEFEVTYDVRENVELYGKTEWDIDDAERDEVTIGMSFSF